MRGCSPVLCREQMSDIDEVEPYSALANELIHATDKDRVAECLRVMRRETPKPSL